MSHSQFPWAVDPRVKTAVFDANGKKCAATVSGHAFPIPLDPETAADNAALIAAIPEMVQVLTLARAHIDACDYDTEAIALSEHITAVLQKVKQP